MDRFSQRTIDRISHSCIYLCRCPHGLSQHERLLPLCNRITGFLQFYYKETDNQCFHAKSCDELGQPNWWFHTYCVVISGTEYENTEYDNFDSNVQERNIQPTGRHQGTRGEGSCLQSSCWRRRSGVSTERGSAECNLWTSQSAKGDIRGAVKWSIGQHWSSATSVPQPMLCGQPLQANIETHRVTPWGVARERVPEQLTTSVYSNACGQSISFSKSVFYPRLKSRHWSCVVGKSFLLRIYPLRCICWYATFLRSGKLWGLLSEREGNQNMYQFKPAKWNSSSQKTKQQNKTHQFATNLFTKLR